jgi:alkanesulfonate monooxygenase SsuD/methylene tetrahydromethanopterin reductase-like flavin-dependent oxidoreductase (luciferase family)
MRLGLFLTGGDDASLLLDVARQADRRGLAALWLPEGAGLFPNPAVAAAAVAVATRRLGVRAGGLSLPLHNPIRVAEEWALVDNLSGGRAGLVADGAAAGIETVRRLWQGEAVRVPDGEGRPIEIRILPQPVQRDLPLWRLLAEPAATDGGGRTAGTAPAFASVAEGLRELRAWEEAGVDEVACRVDLAGALGAVEMLEEILRHGR